MVSSEGILLAGPFGVNATKDVTKKALDPHGICRNQLFGHACQAFVIRFSEHPPTTKNASRSCKRCDPYPRLIASRRLSGTTVRARYIPQSSQINGRLCRRTPNKVTIHPVALFSILDHYLRRSEGQERVIGTLLGTRRDNEIEVKSSFAVLHSETDEQVAVDMEYLKTMYELHHKVNPKEVIVGW